MSDSVMGLVQAMSERLEKAGVSFGHGTTCAWDEAAWLVLWQLALPLDALEEVADDPVAPLQQLAIDNLVTQRITTRKPLAYLTQEAWLQGLSFYVDERAIVPRSFIAELLSDGSLEGWVDSDTHRALDLCTGNGSLAILLALTYPHVQVDASDISADALAVAAVNLERHHLSQHVRLIQSDGLTALTARYDLILCNPPYVNTLSMTLLPPEYQAEPRLALAGGIDGMDLIRVLLRDMPSRLNERGVLVLEVGNEREHFERAFPRLEAVWLETSAGPDTALVLTREALLATP